MKTQVLTLPIGGGQLAEGAIKGLGSGDFAKIGGCKQNLCTEYE